MGWLLDFWKIYMFLLCNTCIHKSWMLGHHGDYILFSGA